MAAKRVSDAMVAIARDDKLVHYKGYGQLDSTKDTPIPLDAVFRTRVHDQANGGGRWADAPGARPLASSGQTRGLLPGLCRHEGGHANGGRFVEARSAVFTDLHSRPLSCPLCAMSGRS
jgi:hypothetical protein